LTYIAPLKSLKMKQKLLFSILLVFAIGNSFAQQFGHLTIFSEDGDKFTLILNGEKINDTPQANLRVEELNQPYYNAKIQFEDGSKQPISKNNLMIADVDGIYKDVTYKIKRDKNNASKMKLNFFSMTDVDPGFLPPSNVKVVHYGQPMQATTSGTVTHTTTTTTSSGNGVGVNAGVNIDGVGIGVNMTVHDPGMQVSHTQTTTTTTSSSHNGHGYGGHGGHDGHSHGCSESRPMSPTNFNSALQTIKGQSFEETRLKTAKQIASANCLSAGQIADICNAFSFEDSKLDFAKAAYSNCTEPNNYFKINNVFSFSSSVDELTEFVTSR